VQEWGAARGEIRSPIARSPGPSILAPVFHGFKDYASPSVRVYFPSLDGSPHNAALLVKCERFPLVMFVHGDCGGDLFQQWISLPAQLARSGYVVAVAKIVPRPADGDPATTAPLRAVHDFMRNTWEFRERLMPRPSTGVMGRSWGGTLAAQLANEIPAAAFTSLSGAFGQTSNPFGLLSNIRVPSLFLWNKIDDRTSPIGADLDDLGAHAPIPPIKHAVIFKTGAHGDDMSNAPRCPSESDLQSRAIPRCGLRDHVPDEIPAAGVRVHRP